MVLHIGTSSGIWSAARDAELSSPVKKLGYVLTRGVTSFELAVDVAHEVTFTMGQEIRHMSAKQGVQPNMHGDLGIPFETPDLNEWRTAQDRVEKSIRSAIFVDAKYICFHTSLNIWHELRDYTGTKLSNIFCDENGRHIEELLARNDRLLNWFAEKRWEDFFRQVLTNKEVTTAVQNEKQIIAEKQREKLVSRLRGTGIDDQLIEMFVNAGVLPRDLPIETQTKIRDIKQEIDEESTELASVAEEDAIKKAMKVKIKKGERWDNYELRGNIPLVDAYIIMGNYLIYTNDPCFSYMWDAYPELHNKYKLNTHDDDWLLNSYLDAEKENDRLFKEFFYAFVSTKYLEGHLKAAFDYVDNTFLKKELPDLYNLKSKDTKDDYDKIVNAAKSLIIGLETPDSREPSHAGLYYLWRPRQIYAAVKAMRKNLNTKRIMIIMDHEHLAMHGVDALLESRKEVLARKDFGALTISCHANHPNPLQPHNPLELGDVVLYELLYNLRVTGMGVDNDAFLVYERGGGQDPFQQSIDILREMGKHLHKSPPTKPDELPMEFYGLSNMTAGDATRQLQVIRDHAFDPMKDLLQIPEEEWTFLSNTALKSGKRPEVWKKGEFR